MRAKLISGDQAVAAERLLWRGARGQLPTSQKPGTTGCDASTATEPDHARAIIQQQTRIHELERELEVRAREAHQKGFAEGVASGASKATSKFNSALEKLASSLRELSGIRRRHLQEAEEDALKLAMAVARKVLHRELTVDPESLLGVVKAAFHRVDAREIHRVRLNPEDIAVVQRHLASAGMPPRLELAPDPSLERGDILIETSRGCLDASVTSQLKEIESGLADLVRRKA